MMHSNFIIAQICNKTAENRWGKNNGIIANSVNAIHESFSNKCPCHKRCMMQFKAAFETINPVS